MEEDAGPAVQGEARQSRRWGAASATQRLLPASSLPQELAAGTRWHRTLYFVAWLIFFPFQLWSRLIIVISVSNLKWTLEQLWEACARSSYLVMSSQAEADPFLVFFSLRCSIFGTLLFTCCPARYHPHHPPPLHPKAKLTAQKAWARIPPSEDAFY